MTTTADSFMNGSCPKCLICQSFSAWWNVSSSPSTCTALVRKRYKSVECCLFMSLGVVKKIIKMEGQQNYPAMKLSSLLLICCYFVGCWWNNTIAPCPSNYLCSCLNLCQYVTALHSFVSFDPRLAMKAK